MFTTHQNSVSMIRITVTARLLLLSIYTMLDCKFHHRSHHKCFAPNGELAMCSQGLSFQSCLPSVSLTICWCSSLCLVSACIGTSASDEATASKHALSQHDYNMSTKKKSHPNQYNSQCVSKEEKRLSVPAG